MLAHERIGSGPPLVLVHGIGHRRQAWHPIVDRQAAEREVILFDLPGHGQSPELVTDGRPVTEVLRDELIALLSELDLDRPHIAGYSLGGRIALEAGADDLVSSVTALAPAGFWHNGLDFAYIRALFGYLTTSAGLLRPVADQFTRPEFVRRAMLAVLYAHPARIEPETAADDLRNLADSRPALRTIIREGEPFERAIADDLPVTIAWGAEDRVLLPYQATRAQRQLPHAAHLRLLDCGHVPMSDDPDLIAGVILRGSAHPVRRTSATDSVSPAG